MIRDKYMAKLSWEKVERLMREQGVNKWELLARSGLANSTIFDRIRNGQKVRMMTAIKLSKGLGVTRGDIEE